jgi:hypothetical protein
MLTSGHLPPSFDFFAYKCITEEKRQVCDPNSLEVLRVQVLTATSKNMSTFWDIAPYSLGEVYRRFIIRAMMEAVHTSETSVYLNETTRCYIPECCQPS